jgi:hyaluronan synthase
LTVVKAIERKVTFPQKCGQRLSGEGKILVSKMGWRLRIFTLVCLGILIGFNFRGGFEHGDLLVVYATLIPVHTLAVFSVGWIFYKNPANGKVGNDLVSVIIPVYNQESMIKTVIDAIFSSTYKNVEVIAVNDGSKDGSKVILDNLRNEYHSLKVIHKENEGKRKAVATGFYESKGKVVVLIDSDSVIEEHAIEEVMKSFNADPQIGGVVGYAKVWNSQKNILTVSGRLV